MRMRVSVQISRFSLVIMLTSLILAIEKLGGIRFTIVSQSPAFEEIEEGNRLRLRFFSLVPTLSLSIAPGEWRIVIYS